MSEDKKPFPVSQKTLVILILVAMATIAVSFIYRVATHGYQ